MTTLQGEPDTGFGLYLHWPYCQTKCPYCDFNSHVVAAIDHKRWLAGYLSEIDRLGRETQGQPLQSVFFGGGTPSLMDPDVVAAIIDRIRTTWRMSNDPEITIEANPGSVEAGRFAAYAAGGVNRVSIGVQSLDDQALRQLGRMHSASEALIAIDIARTHFARVNFDLIYARQDQDEVSWRNELQRALSIHPTHISLYQLTIEEGTVFHDRNARGQLRGLPDEDLSANLFLMTQDMCAKAGLNAYEVSNHAAPGEESRHNLTYWRGGDYVGIGPGAHGRLTLGGTRTATECPKEPLVWLKSVERSGRAELDRTPLTKSDAATEYLLMGLRLYEGVSLNRLKNQFDVTLDPARLQPLVEQGLLTATHARLAATPAGMMLLNSILRQLLAD